MANYQNIEQHFKVGILKELYKRQLITRAELEKAIKITKEQ
jgi:hypothetical protein